MIFVVKDFQQKYVIIRLIPNKILLFVNIISKHLIFWSLKFTNRKKYPGLRIITHYSIYFFRDFGLNFENA